MLVTEQRGFCSVNNILENNFFIHVWNDKKLNDDRILIFWGKLSL